MKICHGYEKLGLFTISQCAAFLKTVLPYPAFSLDIFTLKMYILHCKEMVLLDLHIIRNGMISRTWRWHSSMIPRHFVAPTPFSKSISNRYR